MYQHTIDHTPVSSSTALLTGERSIRPNSSRGATEIHPTGFPSRYARSPGTRPLATTFFMAARLPDEPPRGAPLENSCEVTRNHMHQQPLYPPRSQPNRSTRSSHRAVVTGRTVRLGNGADDSFLE